MLYIQLENVIHTIGKSNTFLSLAGTGQQDTTGWKTGWLGGPGGGVGVGGLVHMSKRLLLCMS